MPSDNMPSLRNHRFIKKTINQILPVEILTMIFLLVDSPSSDNPFAYFPLSWVCRHWRSIMLENPIFWEVIRYKYLTWIKYPTLIQEVIGRSKFQLDISTCKDFRCSKHYDFCPGYHMISESSRIKSLCVESYFLLSNSETLCPESFLRVENLIFCDVPHQSQYSNTVHQLLLACRPRFLQFSYTILNERMLSHKLSHIEWFKFLYAGNTFLDTFYKVLEHMPNLRILNIISEAIPWRSIYVSRLLMTVHPAVITLPNLRMLSWDLWMDGLCLIRTSTLDYLGLSHFSRDGTLGWDSLSCIDLSMTKSLCVRLYKVKLRSKSIRNSTQNFPTACVSTGSSDEFFEGCQIFKHFHNPVSPALGSVDSQLSSLPPKNSFHVELHLLRDFKTMIGHLKRATNLVELTLDYRSFKYGKNNAINHVVVTEMLRTVDTVIHLKILGCRSFTSACEILTSTRSPGKVPHLERLTYHSSFNPIGGADIVPKRLEMMQNARIKFHCQSLKILELRNFVVLPPRQVNKIKKLGIQLIQVP